MNALLRRCLEFVLVCSVFSFVCCFRAFHSNSYTWRRQRHHMARYDPIDGQEDAYSQAPFIPAMGPESQLMTLGDSRPLVRSEYDIIFQESKGLLDCAKEGTWPERELTDGEKAVRQKAIDFTSQTIDDTLLMQRMEQFRKTILGVEKYRINNPANLAEKYSDTLKICLAVEDGWGAAANALTYAGLAIREHVVEPKVASNTFQQDGDVDDDSYDDIEDEGEDSEGEGEEDDDDDDDDEVVELDVKALPVLNVNSLWNKTRFTLLDLDSAKLPPLGQSRKEVVFQGGGNTENSKVPVVSLPSVQQSGGGSGSAIGDDAGQGSETWDQKFWEQNALDEKGEVYLKDMLLSVMRVAINAVLNREDVEGVIVQVSTDARLQKAGHQPLLSSVDLVIGSYYQIMADRDDRSRLFPHDRLEMTRSYVIALPPE